MATHLLSWSCHDISVTVIHTNIVEISLLIEVFYKITQNVFSKGFQNVALLHIRQMKMML